MRRYCLLLMAWTAAWLCLNLGSSCNAQETESSLDALGPAGPVEKVAGDFQFTEGPTADLEGNLYFTDIPNNRIHLLDQSGVSVFLEDSKKANGLMWTEKYGLLACQMDGQVVAINTKDGSLKILANKFDGTRLNAPNDLVIDRQGGIYFTDPLYAAPEPLPQGTMGVYYRAPDGTVTRVVESLPAPNGITLSPDESTLYVVPSQEKRIWAYEVIAPGKLSEGRVFASMAQPPNAPPAGAGGDGCTIDVEGNLYVTTGLGVQVFSKQGKLLGTIEFPEHPANVTFGGKDLRTLYVTARTSLYRVPMKIKGHRFTGTP